jgi:Cdc6-like AAA superfamily ATPase
MSGGNLQVAKQFMVKELTSYQDELFSVLFRDISGFSKGTADRVFGQQDRRISIYGVRGLGKTTAMQGTLWAGLGEKKTGNYVPVNVEVLGVKDVKSPMQLSEIFYKSVILGVNRVAKASRLKNDLAEAAARYSPWVARKITEAVGIIFGPIALASDLSENSVKWLVGRLGYSNIDSLIGSKDLDAQQAATLLIDRLEAKGGKLLFIIDELDKVEDDTVLSDFFDGNQAWFQGKQGIISLSYTFGESLSKTLVTSASRISLIQSFPGIASLEDATDIIRRRVELGLSQIEKNEDATKEAAIKIMPDETVRAILNVSAPNSHIMLERASQAIDKAISLKAVVVSPDHVYAEPAEEVNPTKLEASILQELAASRLSPSIVADRLQKDRGLITRTLKKMMVRDWVGRIGAGKRAYYYITARGAAALQRTKDS